MDKYIEMECSNGHRHRVYDISGHLALYCNICPIMSNSGAARLKQISNESPVAVNTVTIQIRGVMEMECYKGHKRQVHDWDITTHYKCDECGNTLVRIKLLNPPQSANIGALGFPVGLPGMNVDQATTGRIKSECAHEYVSYVGLMETYDFCRICDVKKETAV